MLALEVRDAIVGHCRAALPAATVTTSLIKNVPELWIVIGPIEWSSSDWASIGNRRVEENISIGFMLRLVRKARTAEAVEHEALTLTKQVEERLRANPTLGTMTAGSQVISVKLNPDSSQAAATDEGAIALVEATITAMCRT